jgi:hypothetical protein
MMFRFAEVLPSTSPPPGGEVDARRVSALRRVGGFFLIAPPTRLRRDKRGVADLPALGEVNLGAE